MLSHNLHRWSGDVIPNRTWARMGMSFYAAPEQALMSIQFGECESVLVRTVEALSGTPEGGVNYAKVEMEKALAPGSRPRALMVTVNGVDRTRDLGGPFYADVENLDIRSYLTAGFNEVIFETAQAGRINVTVDLLVPWTGQQPGSGSSD